MYDELVERLRYCAVSDNQCLECKYRGGSPDGSKMCFDLLMEDAADAIEELSKPRWIPVTERLPEKEGSVLIFSELGGIAEGHYSHMYGGWVQYRWSVKDIKVSHWMPLPEPPKEETECSK